MNKKRIAWVAFVISSLWVLIYFATALIPNEWLYTGSLEGAQIPTLLGSIFEWIGFVPFIAGPLLIIIAIVSVCVLIAEWKRSKSDGT